MMTAVIVAGTFFKRDYVFSRRDTPEFCAGLCPPRSRRAQGMPGDGLAHGPPAKK
jgi:hypothetical protein